MIENNMTTIKIIDNFLEEDEFNKIRDVLMSDNFPW